MSQRILTHRGPNETLAQPVQDIAELKLTATTDTDDKQGIYVEDELSLYFYDYSSVEAESLPDVVQPTAGAGRWYRNQASASAGAELFRLRWSQEQIVEAAETVTIPAGHELIIQTIQVDGTLVVDGDLVMLLPGYDPAAAAALLAGNGLVASGSTIGVVPANTTLQVDADSMQVRLKASAGLSFDVSGIFLLIDGAPFPSLQAGAGGVSVRRSSTGGIGLGANGLQISHANEEFLVDGGGIFRNRLDGSSLSKGASGLRVANDGVGLAQIGARPYSDFVVADGVLVAFNLSTRITASGHRGPGVRVFVDGLRVQWVNAAPADATQYTITDSGVNTTVTFGAAPTLGAKLTFDFYA